MAGFEIAIVVPKGHIFLFGVLADVVEHTNDRFFFAKIFDGVDVGEKVADVGFFEIFSIVGDDVVFLLNCLEEVAVRDEEDDGCDEN